MGDVGLAAHNIDNLGIKAFFKTAGKTTAKALFKGSDEDGKETEEKKLRKDEPLSQAEERVVMKEDAPTKDVQKEKEEKKKQ